MKKLYVTFVTGLIVSCLCLAMSVIVGNPFGGTPKTNVAKAETVATADAADATYTFSVTTPSSSSPVVIGPNRQVDLQDGESVVMQFTILSCTFSYHTDGILVSKRNGIPTSNPMSSVGAIGWIHNGGAADFSGKVGEGETNFNKDEKGNGATIFAVGNTVRATFTPMQSQTELGVFTIEYKTAGSNDWVLGAKASGLGESFGRDAQIWLFFSVNAAASASITLTDYTITTTYGANLLDSENGRESENANNNGLWVYDTIGLAYVHGESMYTAKAYTEVVHKITYGSTAGLYPSKAASISDGGSAILEFSLSEANITWSGNFGFTIDSMYVGTNAYVYSSQGVWLYSQNGSNFNKTGKYSTNVTFDTTYNCSSHDIMEAGNSVKVVYTPAYGTDCDGVFEIYTKTTTDTDYQLKVKATGLGSDLKSSVFISIYTNNSSNNYTLKTYKYYTVDSEGNETVYHDNNIESLKFASSVSGNTITSICNDVNVSVKENAMSFTGTEKDYTVYVKDGESYKLPAYTTAEKEIFLGYAIDGKLYRAGDVYTPTANVTVTALSIRNFENLGASIRVGGFMGIRFENTYNTADYTAASAYITELGTLIARVEDITSAENLTTSTNENVKKIVSTRTFAEKDGVTTYAGGISNLKVDNYGKDLAGCGYITVTYADNTTATFYTNILVRSAKSVAEMAIKDQTEGSIEYTILSAYINGEAYPSDTEVE